MRGCQFDTPSIMCILGPNISASSSPTLYPLRAKATAKLTEIVDFPTPPLPEPTTIMFCTSPTPPPCASADPSLRGCNGARRTSTCSSPTTTASATRTVRISDLPNGSFGPRFESSTTTRSGVHSSTRTKPNLTISSPVSGWRTPDSASITRVCNSFSSMLCRFYL